MLNWEKRYLVQKKNGDTLVSLEQLQNLKVEVTDYGFRIVGWKESILPLGRLARVKYKKKLKSKRLLKKYAKKILEEAINNFLKENKHVK